MGQRVQQQEFYIEVDDKSDPNVSYIGRANVNSDGDTSRAIWQVIKWIEDDDGSRSLFADGDLKFDNKWDDHLTLDYK